MFVSFSLGTCLSNTQADASSRMLKSEDGVAGTIPVLAQRAASEGWGGSGQVPSLLAERAR